MNSINLIVSSKPWNTGLGKRLQERLGGQWLHLKEKQDLNKGYLHEINPQRVFIPHWSHIIPKEVYSNYECIVFHMTDLPYGRGGSPLQNLIKRGYSETKMSALRVEEGLDAGDIYLKEPLSLLGTAEEIFLRADRLIEDMIAEIVTKDISPEPQEGQVVEFSRRKPEESIIRGIKDLNELHDHIRMLDAEGYPKAFLVTENFRFEFERSSLRANKIIADVTILKKGFN